MSVMERSSINTLEIRTLLKHSLSHDIKSRKTYVDGIKKSFEYEGYYIEIDTK